MVASRARCDAVREAISARLDGEQAPTPVPLVGEHLDRCARCRDFALDAATIAERARRSALVPLRVPDRTDEILFALACSESRRGRCRALRSWFPRTRWVWAAGWAAAALPVGVAAPMLAAGGPAQPAAHLVARVAAPAAALPHGARPCTPVLVWPRGF